MAHYEIPANPDLYREVGLTGVILFASVGLFSLYLLVRRKIEPTKNHKTFFGLMLLTELLDIPRYAVMLTTGTYEQTWPYCLHLLSSVFFFWALSLLFYLWNAMIQSKRHVEMIKSLLIFINAIFLAATAVAFFQCALKKSLDGFFSSNAVFIAYTWIDCSKNILYMSVMDVAGCKLLSRIRNVQAFDRGLLSTVRKIVIVLSVATLTFVLRGFMLIVKSYLILKNQEELSWFPVSAYSYKWWIISDFIPRFVNEVTFQVLLANSVHAAQYRHHQKLSSSTSSEVITARENYPARLQNDLRAGLMSSSDAATDTYADS